MGGEVDEHSCMFELPTIAGVCKQKGGTVGKQKVYMCALIM